MAENEFETSKIGESSMSLQEIQVDKNNSEETRKSVTLSTDDSIKNNETNIFCPDERKNSHITLNSGTNKFFKEMKKCEITREYSDDPEQRRIVNFLRAKGLSENLIGRVLKNGLTNGFDRLLRALGITNEEMKQFAWKKSFDTVDCVNDSPDYEGSTMNFQESSMSPDNLYLKKYFGHSLVRAMKDIVKKKPCDPVDFLGNWLIDYMVSEERENRREEFEAELAVERELSKSPEMDLESEIIDYDEREESLENDWNYGEYEQSEMQ